MPNRDIIVIGASAGGVEALMDLVQGLPADLPAAIFISVHFPPDGTSFLPDILNRRSALPAAHAQDGEPIELGRIYVAPPDLHLIVEESYVRTSHGPRENRARPAIDPLFRSAARAYGRRAIAVLLSGMLNDGTAGLMAIKARGGIAVVQDPEDALFPSMPRNAVDFADVDHVLPLAEIAPLLARLAQETVDGKGAEPMQDEMEKVTTIVRHDMDAQARGEMVDRVSVYTCPECGGVLWQVQDGRIVRFHCHVGHVYSAESLLVDQSAALEAALWAAVRALQQKVTLARQMQNRALRAGNMETASRFGDQVRLAEYHVSLIQDELFKGVGAGTEEAILSEETREEMERTEDESGRPSSR